MPLYVGTRRTLLTPRIVAPSSAVVPDIVQIGSVPGSTYPVAFTFPSAITPGNRIITMGGHSYSVTPTKVSDPTLGANLDSLGNTYAFDGTQILASGIANLEVLSGLITVGGSCTVTLTAAAGNPVNRFFFLEVSGLAASSPYDAEAATAVASSAGDSGAATTIADGDLLLGMFLLQYAGRTWTPGTGWTPALLPSTSASSDCLLSQIAGAAGAYDATATASGASESCMAAIVAYKHA